MGFIKIAGLEKTLYTLSHNMIKMISKNLIKALFEKIDIVNDNDEIIGQKPRFLVRLRKYRHRGSSIIITKDLKGNKILLQKRSKSITFPGKLCIPGGSVQVGDSYLNAAKRELQEEMFANVKLPKEIKLHKLFKIKKETDKDPEFNTVYSTRYNGSFVVDPDEVEEYLFKDIDEALKEIKLNPEIYTETTALLLKKYKEFKRNR